MRIDRIGVNEQAVVVLGAGATRGASFTESLPGALPPLNGDFFTQAQRLSALKRQDLLPDLIENTVRLFGTNFSLTMEDFLTHVEHLTNIFADYRLQGRPADNPYPRMREQFMQVLAALLDESIGRRPACTYHGTLVDALSVRDTVISFNYDWLLDETLRARGQGKWDPRFGYGVAAYTKGPRGRGTEYWACSDPTGEYVDYPGESITVLKMHGSMNWFPVPQDREPPVLQLRQRWWHQRGGLDFEIVPPEWNKPIRSGIYKHIWRKARQTLRETTCLTIIGYSLPATDLPAQALFMVDTHQRRQAAAMLKHLVLVNPDRIARARIRSVLARRIGGKTRVVTFDTLCDFAGFLNNSTCSRRSP